MSITTPSRARVWSLCTAVFMAIVLVSASASAQSEASKKQARELYQQGKTQFDLGNFEEAVRLFKEAYAASPYPELLFNIAQAYRQSGDCRQALFFYKRYLTVAGDDAHNKELVEGHIKDLTRTCQASEEVKSKPPLGAMTPKDGDQPRQNRTRVAVADDDDDDYDDDDDRIHGGSITRPHTRKEPSLVAGTAALGPSFLGSGELEVSGAQLTVALGAAYPLSFGSVGLSVGGLVTYTPVPWSNEGMSGTMSFTSALFNVGARMWLLERLAVRGELGLGGLFLGGLTEGNVFLPPGETTTGALSMFNVRVGLGAEYLLTDSIALSVSPLVYSRSAAKEGLRAGVDAFTRFELLLGIGYSR